jgi:hypothetical protein
MGKGGKNRRNDGGERKEKMENRVKKRRKAR